MLRSGRGVTYEGPPVAFLKSFTMGQPPIDHYKVLVLVLAQGVHVSAGRLAAANAHIRNAHIRNAH